MYVIIFPFTWTYLIKSCPSAEVRTLLIERLDVLLQYYEKVMNNAQYRQVINDLDAFLLIEGRFVIKEVFEQKLQERIVKKEQTQEAAQCTN